MARDRRLAALGGGDRGVRDQPAGRTAGEALGAIHPGFGPQKDDIFITKHRVSAFRGTDLELILHAKEIATLVLFGIATSGVVLSTLLEASDRDYRLVVIRDCCVDRDAELHSNLIDKVFSQRATVLSASEFLAAASWKP